MGDGCFLRSVEEELEYFLDQSVAEGCNPYQQGQVLAFPPLLPRYRFLIHQLVEERFPQLVTRSVGSEEERRIIVSWKEINSTASPSRSMIGHSVEPEEPVSLTAKSSQRIRKNMRPSMQTYVPPPQRARNGKGPDNLKTSTSKPTSSRSVDANGSAVKNSTHTQVPTSRSVHGQENEHPALLGDLNEPVLSADNVPVPNGLSSSGSRAPVVEPREVPSNIGTTSWSSIPLLEPEKDSSVLYPPCHGNKDAGDCKKDCAGDAVITEPRRKFSSDSAACSPSVPTEKQSLYFKSRSIKHMEVCDETGGEIGSGRRRGKAKSSKESMMESRGSSVHSRSSDTGCLSASPNLSRGCQRKFSSFIDSVPQVPSDRTGDSDLKPSYPEWRRGTRNLAESYSDHDFRRKEQEPLINGGAAVKVLRRSDIQSSPEAQRFRFTVTKVVDSSSAEKFSREVLEELEEVFGKVELNHTSEFSREYSVASTRPTLATAECRHVVEIFDFPASYSEADLRREMQFITDEPFDLRWVDDTHALGVFSSENIVKNVLSMKNSGANATVRSLNAASEHSRRKALAYIKVDVLSPFKERPETNAAAARRMVAGALGMNISVPEAKRQQEVRQLKDARHKRQHVIKQKEDVWEGRV